MKKYSSVLSDSLCLLCGAFLLAIGIQCFLNPNKISPGGVSTIGTVLFHLWGVKLSVTNLVCNIVLFALGFRFLGKNAVFKTVAGVLLLSVFLELAAQLPAFLGDAALATVAGGVLVGLGLGLVVRRGASTGGTDFAALVLKRFFPHISLAHFILIIDCVIIAIAGLVFRDVTVTVYSVISMYICSKVTDWVVTAGDAAKAVIVISEHNTEIADSVMKKFERGVTGLHSEGMYSHQKNLLLFCVVSPKQLPPFIAAVRKIDSRAFVVVQDAREVIGEGFKKKTDYDFL